MQQKKWLLKIFFLSIGLNVLLFALLCFFTLREPTLVFSYRPLAEKPPLAKTLFTQLQETNTEEISQAFMRTEEFHLVRLLFATTPLAESHLLELLLAGDFSLLESYCDEQKRGVDFSEKRRIQFLTSYLQKEVEMAAYLLLVTDFDRVLCSFDDEELGLLLKLMTKKTPLTDKFVEAACTRLNGEVTGRFVPRPGIGELRPVFREPTPKSPAPQEYIVQPGDSLWLIAKRHHISIEEIKERNNLRTDILRPGQTLRMKD